MPNPNALTTENYWDGFWSDRPVPSPLDPSVPGLNGTVPRAFHALFAECFSRAKLQPSDAIIEIGCGGSQFLPYFRREWGMDAKGIDYSPEGCSLARAISQRAQVPVTILQADVFKDDPGALGLAPMVFSCGLVEHFRPTSSIVQAIARWSSGYVLTIVPNLYGAIGMVQRAVQRDIFDGHVPLTPDELSRAHSECGLAIIDSGYLMSANFGIVNPTGNPFAAAITRGTSWASKAVWSLERIGIPVPKTHFMSPYAYVLARKQTNE